MKRWIALLVFLGFATTALAQSVATLRGHITDGSGAAIGGAKVKVTLVTTGAGREVVTDSSGGYEFSQLQPGRYTMEVSADGFQSARREGLDLLVATASSIDVALGVQSVKQEVVVTGEAAITVNT